VQFTEAKVFKVVVRDEYDIWGSDGGKHLGYGRDLKKYKVSPNMLTTTRRTSSHFWYLVLYNCYGMTHN
jgi:hypothetical protein